MKQIILIVLAVVAIIGGAVILGKDNSASGEPSNNYYGQEQGIITVTEYGDFECPACGQYAPIVTQVKEQFKDQIRFEYRHFPLINIHGNAQAAHRAAEAAAKQGKFWEMHDLLYQRQNNWNSAVGVTNPSQIFEEYAEELGLNMEQYRTDVADSTTLATINADIQLGKDNDVSSTPTFIVAGVKVDNSEISTPEAFAKIIEEAIKSSSDQTDSTENNENIQEEAKPEESDSTNQQ